MKLNLKFIASLTAAAFLAAGCGGGSDDLVILPAQPAPTVTPTATPTVTPTATPTVTPTATPIDTSKLLPSLN